MAGKRVHTEGDFLSSSGSRGPLVELVNQVHTLKMAVTFSSTIRDCQRLREGQMLRGFAEPAGFELGHRGKRAGFKVRNRWRPLASE